MIVGLSLDAEIVYESDYDTAKGTDEATKWTLGTLDARQFGKIKDRSTRILVDPNRPDAEIETSINKSEVAYLTVQYGLKGWDNFCDKQGNQIEFKTKGQRMGGKSYTVVHDDSMAQIPHVIIEELAEKISATNDLTEEETKNSQEP